MPSLGCSGIRAAQAQPCRAEAGCQGFPSQGSSRRCGEESGPLRSTHSCRREVLGPAHSEPLSLSRLPVTSRQERIAERAPTRMLGAGTRAGRRAFVPGPRATRPAGVTQQASQAPPPSIMGSLLSNITTSIIGNNGFIITNLGVSVRPGQGRTRAGRGACEAVSGVRVDPVRVKISVHKFGGSGVIKSPRSPVQVAIRLGRL